MADMTLSEELEWRGFIHQTTFEDIKQLDKKDWTFYHGFDASADSQTVGNLAGMMFDRVLMRHGCKAYILAGGATSLIGDPIWKDAERPLQDEATIAHNVSCAEEQLQKIFTGYDFTLVNNLDWTKNLTVIAFLRDIGKHFGMTPLIQRDYMARRLGEGGSGITYTEFSYTLLQGMDFLHLFDSFGVTLQVGSSDQWGNCLSGVELIRRTRNTEAHVLTHPLVINKATGKKFGKSEEGAVWLDPQKTSPTQFYQFWINADDEGVEDYLKVYTELSKETIGQLMLEHSNDPKERRAQKKLAQEVTRLVHGLEEAKVAEDITAVITGQASVGGVDERTLEAMRKEVPSARISQDGLIAEALVKTGLATSNTEARQLVGGGAVYINGQAIHRTQLQASDFQSGRLLLRKGKVLKNTALVEQD